MKAKTLAKIEQEIEVHRMAIADLRQQGIALLTGEQPEETPATKVKSATAKKPRTPRSEGLPARIKALFAERVLTVFSADEVIGELKMAGQAQQVRTTLSKLVKRGEIASPEKGRYQALASV